MKRYLFCVTKIGHGCRWAYDSRMSQLEQQNNIAMSCRRSSGLLRLYLCELQNRTAGGCYQGLFPSFFEPWVLSMAERNA